MKTIRILFLCIIASIFVNAQNAPMHTLTEVEVNPPKFVGKTIVEQMPKSSIGKYFATNFEYPEVIGLVHEGIEVVQFTVNPSGKLDGFKVINSVSPQVDKEVIRVLKTTNHMWLPGHNNGTPVAMEHEIAIQVKCIDLDGSASKKDFTELATNFYNKGIQKLFIEGKTNKALKHFETALRYKPYDKCLLYMRAVCNAELGETISVQQDIARIQKLGGIKVKTSYLSGNIKKLEGYDIISASLKSL